MAQTFRFCLRQIEGVDPLKVILKQGRNTIGRQPGSDFLLENNRVSRRHAEVVCSGTDCRIIDLGSASGTWVNGVSLTPHVPILLATNDIIEIAEQKLIFEQILLPVIFLAFANDQHNSGTYLRNLADEQRRLRKILDREETLYQVIIYPNITIDELVDGLHRYRNRIVIFHYGGHSDSYSLLLESANGHSEVIPIGSFAKLLAQQKSLQLIFLNCPSSQEQVQSLLDAGIPTVITAIQNIQDEVAMEFAESFYKSLATANATIQEAFNEAVSVIEARYSDEIR